MKWPVLALAGLLAGCASTEIASPLSVSEVQSRQRELHGQVVLVRGYLMGCEYDSCRLSASPLEHPQGQRGPATLSVGGNDAFAAAVSISAPAEVILKVRVGGFAALDEATGAADPGCCDLEAIEIERVVREIEGRRQ